MFRKNKLLIIITSIVTLLPVAVGLAMWNILPDKIADIVEGSSVRVVDYGVVPVYPVSPNVTKFALVGFLLGGVLSVGFIILLELLNNSIRSEEYLIQTYDLPVLAVVPAMTRKSRRKKGSASQSKATMVGGNN